MTAFWVWFALVAVIAIPAAIWLTRRATRVMDVIESPQRHSRRVVVAVNVGVCVLMVIGLSGLLFINRGAVQNGNPRYRWMSFAFPEKSLYEATNWWGTGACIALICVAVAIFGRFALRVAFRPRKPERD